MKLESRVLPDRKFSDVLAVEKSSIKSIMYRAVCKLCNIIRKYGIFQNSKHGSQYRSRRNRSKKSQHKNEGGAPFKMSRLLRWILVEVD